MLFIRTDCVLSCSHFAHWGKFGILRYINNTISTCCWESNLILFVAPSCTAHWVCQSNRVLPFYHKDNIFVSGSLLHFQYTLPTSEAILSDRDSDSAKAQQRLMLILSSVLHPYRTTFPFSGDYLSVQPSEQDEQVCVPSAAVAHIVRPLLHMPDPLVNLVIKSQATSSRPLENNLMDFYALTCIVYISIHFSAHLNTIYCCTAVHHGHFKVKTLLNLFATFIGSVKNLSRMAGGLNTNEHLCQSNKKHFCLHFF